MEIAEETKQDPLVWGQVPQMLLLWEMGEPTLRTFLASMPQCCNLKGEPQLFLDWLKNVGPINTKSLKPQEVLYPTCLIAAF